MTPAPVDLAGRHVLVTPLRRQHAAALWGALRDEETFGVWEYLFDGPFLDEASFLASLEKKTASADPLYFALVEAATGEAQGYASYMRIEAAHLVVEVGNILYTPALQRTVAATEAMYLMAQHVFEDLGYRRYEWKCNALNQPSRSAAKRLGFTFEGVFRQHMLVKGRNRDTAWFSMLDSEWPERKIEFERWLHASNFDASGNQLTRLSHASATTKP